MEPSPLSGAYESLSSQLKQEEVNEEEELASEAQLGVNAEELSSPLAFSCNSVVSPSFRVHVGIICVVLLVGVFFFIYVIVGAMTTGSTIPPVSPAAVAIERACTVYCSGGLLDAVQMSGVFEDSKSFVDMPMRHDPELILEAFMDMAPEKKQDKTALRAFVEAHFDAAGSDLEAWLPPDWKAEPSFVGKIEWKEYREWGLEIHKLWELLGRKVKDVVKMSPQRHSFLPRRSGMIVPGGRFRESYYWDSFWIIRGLLVSEMEETASQVIDNLLEAMRHQNPTSTSYEHTQSGVTSPFCKESYRHIFLTPTLTLDDCRMLKALASSPTVVAYTISIDRNHPSCLR